MSLGNNFWKRFLEKVKRQKIKVQNSLKNA